MGKRVNRLLCRILGHDLDPIYTQPEKRFEQGWNGWLGETLWYEIFDHDCRRCQAHIRAWRWTRAAAAKMADKQ